MFSELIEKEKQISETETPTLGGYGAQTFGDEVLNRKLPELQVRYGSFNLSDSNDLMMLETIMTKSLRCGDSLNDPGDIRVIQEQINCNREGDYLVMIKYMEVKSD